MEDGGRPTVLKESVAPRIQKKKKIDKLFIESMQIVKKGIS